MSIIKHRVPPRTPISTTPTHPIFPLTLSSMYHSHETFWRSKNEESGPRLDIPMDSALQYLILSFKFSPGPRQPEFHRLLLLRDPAAFSSFQHYPAQESSSLSPKMPNSLLHPSMRTQASGPQTPDPPSNPRSPAPTCLGSWRLLTSRLERLFTLTPQCLASLANF